MRHGGCDHRGADDASIAAEAAAVAVAMEVLAEEVSLAGAAGAIAVNDRVAVAAAIRIRRQNITRRQIAAPRKSREKNQTVHALFLPNGSGEEVREGPQAILHGDHP